MTEKGHLSFNWFEVISVNHYCILWGLHPETWEEKFPLNAFFESPALHFEKWNEFLFYYQQSLCYHMEKECPVRPCIMALVCAETGVTLIYIMGNCEARQSQNCFTTKQQLVGNHPGVCKHGWWSQMLPSAKMTAWCLVSRVDPWVSFFKRLSQLRNKSRNSAWTPPCMNEAMLSLKSFYSENPDAFQENGWPLLAP